MGKTLLRVYRICMLKPFLNQVFKKDVLEILKNLPDNSIDMIYGDPDYNVGINYSGKKFTKKWNKYISWYIELNKECLRVLKPRGNMYMINYPRQNAHLRTQFLEGNAHDVFEYVWVYRSNIGQSKRRFTTAHRSILHITKSKDNKFYKNQVALPYQQPNDKRIKAQIKKGSKGRMPYSWFHFNLVNNKSKEKTFHPCQIPVKLAEMLIKSCTKKGDSVFVLFGGSGNEILLTKRLQRKFISCEIHPTYFKRIQKRIRHSVIK